MRSCRATRKAVAHHTKCSKGSARHRFGDTNHHRFWAYRQASDRNKMKHRTRGFVVTPTYASFRELQNHATSSGERLAGRESCVVPCRALALPLSNLFSFLRDLRVLREKFLTGVLETFLASMALAAS
jgi:hypothetical protein